MIDNEARPVLSVNGIKFSHISEPGSASDVSGYYRVERGGVILMERDLEPIALICGNDDLGRPWRGDGFIVTASRQPGRAGIWYMHSTSTITEKRLGLIGATCREVREIAHAVIRQSITLASRWAPLPQQAAANGLATSP